MTTLPELVTQAEAFLASLPALSRPVIDHYFRHAPALEQKADNSPVTIADKSVETVLRQAVQSHFPEHAIIGEEQGGVADKPFCWVIDPIDGTRAFVIGKPLFGTLVAMVHNGIPLCGMIDMPALKECYLTKQGRSFLVTTEKQSLLQTGSCTQLATAQIATTSPEAFTDKGWQQFQLLSSQCRSSHYGGDCYNYALLAAGNLDLVVEHQLAPHDLMALVPVMQQAGGVVTDWHGQEVRLDGDGSVLAAATPELHEQALSYLHPKRVS